MTQRKSATPGLGREALIPSDESPANIEARELTAKAIVRYLGHQDALSAHEKRIFWEEMAGALGVIDCTRLVKSEEVDGQRKT